MSHPDRVALIQKDVPGLSLGRQAELLGVSRSSLYYTPAVSTADILLMRYLDEIYTKYPFYGSRRLRWQLRNSYELTVCRDHVRRLMGVMGLEAIYPKPRIQTSDADPTNPTYPYLLSGLTAAYPNHVWGTDITYIRLAEGFAYLVAFLDWYSRYVVSWHLSPTLEGTYVQEAARAALKTGVPEISNSDRGSQFTSRAFTSIFLERETNISQDGRGRCMDNIFTERLWRTVKYENVYLNSYATIPEATTGLTDFFHFYNHERPHSSLNNQTPASLYFTR